MKKKSTIYIDADIVLHSCCHGTQYLVSWDNAPPDTVANIYEAVDTADTLIKRIMQETVSTECVLVFSDSSGKYFRHAIYPSYKSNRKCNPTPALKDRLKVELCAKYPNLSVPELEADDILAAAKTAGCKVATIDKDLKQVPGKHYSWYHQCWVHSTELEAMRYFYTQVLAGDQSDGYKGCPGIGYKKANAALSTCNTEVACWAAVVALFTRAFGCHDAGVQHAILNARMAWLLRAIPEPPIKLWEPPTETEGSD